MAIFSYNEITSRRLELRHIFFPSAYGLVAEIVIALTALTVFNLQALTDQLLSRNIGNVDPLPLWEVRMRQFLDGTQHYQAVERVLLFAAWALFGALMYILIFRLLQAAFGVKSSVGLGVSFVRENSVGGIFYWLASLHDFFIKLIIIVLGGGAFAFGVILCFGIAIQELRNGLAGSFPGSLWLYLLSLVAAVLSVRLIGLGLSLLWPRFREWYTS